MKRALITALLILVVALPILFISTTSGAGTSNDITSSTTWTKNNSPYTVAGTITVQTGATLTIEPGAAVNIAQDGSLRVEGTLIAKGTSIDNIQLNGPGELVLTSACTDWNEQASSGTIIEKAIINRLLITIYNSPKIYDNTIYGRIQLYGGSPKITYNSIEAYIEGNTNQVAPVISNNNIVGQIHVEGGSPTITQNYIKGMQHPGNSASSGIVLTATNGANPLHDAVVTDNTIIDVLDGISVLADGGTITNNLIVNCSRFGLSLGTLLETRSTADVENNTIINANVGFHLFNYNGGTLPPIIMENNIVNSSQYNVEFYCGLNMSLTYNWWGTADSEAIKQLIRDHTFDPYAGTVTYVPLLTELNPFAYPKSNSGIPGPITIVLPEVNASMSPNSFAIESNSTVSALFYNPANPEIDFTVNGTTGTGGYVKATISKALMPSSEGIKVYLDGNPVDCTITSSDDAWIIMFTYHHSTHQVRINQENASYTGGQGDDSYLFYILLVAVPAAIIGLIFVVIYVSRKNNKALIL